MELGHLLVFWILGVCSPYSLCDFFFGLLFCFLAVPLFARVHGAGDPRDRLLLQQSLDGGTQLRLQFSGWAALRSYELDKPLKKVYSQNPKSPKS